MRAAVVPQLGSAALDQFSDPPATRGGCGQADRDCLAAKPGIRQQMTAPISPATREPEERRVGSLQSSPRRLVTIALGTGRGQLLIREGSVQPNLRMVIRGSA